ncbi:uncharacterized protein A4U43_C07F3230 [Asparagus officinalis]|uniref:Uncharacterized protein n=1 Tax=Asparagus officinalis TaxID=4686 RepID=A0A5P1E903_ASPOF|nr:uncharacterized protein A4U43_C07F3230 [Asparagus officinalis]
MSAPHVDAKMSLKRSNSAPDRLGAASSQTSKPKYGGLCVLTKTTATSATSLKRNKKDSAVMKKAIRYCALRHSCEDMIV